MKKQKARKSISTSTKLKLSDERVRFTAALATLLLSLYVCLAFFSYFFTWKEDQSFIWQNAISSADIVAQNLTGKYGAKLANFFILKGIGLSAFFIPVLIFLFSLKLFKYNKINYNRTFRFLIYLAILTSVIFGFIFGSTRGYWGNGLGGEYGLHISTWLLSFIGKIGTAFLLLTISSTIVIYFNKNIYDIIKANFYKIRNKEVIISEPIIENTVDNLESISKEDSELKPSLEDTSINELKEEEETCNMKENEEVVFFQEESVSSSIIEKLPPTQEGDVELTIEKKAEEEMLDDKEIKNIQFENYDPTLDLPKYTVPPIELLDDHQSDVGIPTNEELAANKKKIIETLENYNIKIESIKATIGPTVTLYEIIPAPGIRISKIKSLEDDIALSLAALGIRIIAPIPGKGTIGIEVPNPNPQIVSMRSIIKSAKFQNSKFDLAIALGKTVSSEIYVCDLAKMPHLLVAGATGQGKSVGLNAILTSLLYKKHPSQIKFVMIDPKKVELSIFSVIEKHFLAKLPDEQDAIITDTDKVINTLSSLCIEMDNRYELLKAAHVRNIKEYNTKFINRVLNPEKGHKYLPYIVVVIDEFADLIMTAGKEVEMPIARLAQLARAIGIHLIIATQRPTTNIITGVIKANFPARIAFRVTSSIDSRTILDSPGANQLIGRGDMLISTGNDLTRIQCAYVDTPEIERITQFIGAQNSYPSAFILPEAESDSNAVSKDFDIQKRDDLFEEAANVIVMQQQGSTSLIQRKFSIGYNRAGRIIDQLEAVGIVGPYEGSKARQVLIPDTYALEQFLNTLKN
ncbi:MAG: DNA translocase FtsK 4TM domain-containing protein [Bacteroidales bacterium]|nr:DNA translocase FtsK 4TM domain-containing protein [Bacteroidales bacterium]